MVKLMATWAYLMLKMESYLICLLVCINQKKYTSTSFVNYLLAIDLSMITTLTMKTNVEREKMVWNWEK